MGRWRRKNREERLCDVCGVIGDEFHAVFHCDEIDRSDLNLPLTFEELWECDDVWELFVRLGKSNLL